MNGTNERHWEPPCWASFYGRVHSWVQLKLFWVPASLLLWSLLELSRKPGFRAGRAKTSGAGRALICQARLALLLVVYAAWRPAKARRN